MGFRRIHTKFFVIAIALILFLQLIDSAHAKGGGRGGGGKSGGKSRGGYRSSSTSGRGGYGGGGGGGGLAAWEVVLIVLASLIGLICCCGFCMQICEDEGSENKPIQLSEVGDEDVKLEMTSMLNNTGTTTTITTENSATHTLISNGGTASGWTFESSSSNDNGISKSYVVINDMPK